MCGQKSKDITIAKLLLYQPCKWKSIRWQRLAHSQHRHYPVILWVKSIHWLQWHHRWADLNHQHHEQTVRYRQGLVVVPVAAIHHVSEKHSAAHQSHIRHQKWNWGAGFITHPTLSIISSLTISLCLIFFHQLLFNVLHFSFCVLFFFFIFMVQLLFFHSLWLLWASHSCT